MLQTGEKKKYFQRKQWLENACFWREINRSIKKSGHKGQSTEVSFNNSNRSGTSWSLQPSAQTVNTVHMDSNSNMHILKHEFWKDTTYTTEQRKNFTGRILLFGSESTTSVRHPLSPWLRQCRKEATAQTLRWGENPSCPHALQYSQLQQVLPKAATQCEVVQIPAWIQTTAKAGSCTTPYSLQAHFKCH